MKTSLEWLGEYVGGPLDGQGVADALTRGGLPVETIDAIGDDTVVDVEVTSNRGDCLCHLGVARELSALLNRPFRDVQPRAAESAEPAAKHTAVAIEALNLCPHYTARILRNVKVGPSPAWMVRRLEALGLRSINNVVDVTNYVMFEMGQPLHAFDFDKLAGRRIVVRTARKGEKIVSIDGRERELSASMLVIADAEKPVAVAGVMGGLESEVTGNTVNVLLESARFDPLSVRQTSRRLALKSDSSYRFERGIDPTLPLRASLRAAELILQTARGELLAGAVEAGSGQHAPRKLLLRPGTLQRILGVDIVPERAVEALQRLMLQPVRRPEGIEVTVPSWRLDLNIEADLVEEVARVIGYDAVPVREEISIRVTPPEPTAKSVALIRQTLVAGGYFEAVTFSWLSDGMASDFVPPEAKSLPRADPAVRKVDASLRPSILPGLLEAVRHNESVGTEGARLFEIGSVFWTDAAGKLVETRRIGLAGGDLRVVRGVIETLLERLNAARAVRIDPGEGPGYEKGAAGRIFWGGEPIGRIGRIDAGIVHKLSLRHTPAAAELDLLPLLQGAQLVPQLKPLPRFPAVRRDLSLIVSDATAYQAIDALVRHLKLPDLEQVEYVTTYRGKPLEKGQKSVTITLVFRSAEQTLTSEQVESAVNAAIDTAKTELGATLRA